MRRFSRSDHHDQDDEDGCGGAATPPLTLIHAASTHTHALSAAGTECANTYTSALIYIYISTPESLFFRLFLLSFFLRCSTHSLILPPSSARREPRESTFFRECAQASERVDSRNTPHRVVGTVCRARVPTVCVYTYNYKAEQQQQQQRWGF